MLRTDVGELHYITSTANLASIMSMGILSHQLAAAIPHHSVASERVQDVRRYKQVPNAAPLHSYVNLYFDARNPMLSVLLFEGHTDLVILRISSAALDIPGTIVCDGNAASKYTRFFPSPSGLCYLNKELIFANDWTDSVQVIEWEKKRIRNAEVLVPGRVNVSYIQGCYVSTTCPTEVRQAIPTSLNTTENGRIYFR
jgi:ssDNA thymidine ADP-ribosyltransferase, DarT